MQKIPDDQVFGNNNINNNKKGNSNGGIFDNISNVFSKMMNDT